MSYSISLTIDTGGAEPATIDVEPFHMYRHTAAALRTAGIDVGDFDGRLASECAARLGDAIPTLYGARAALDLGVTYEDWGIVVLLVERMHVVFVRHPKCTVRVRS